MVCSGWNISLFSPGVFPFSSNGRILRKDRRVINFSVKGDVEEICNASSKITVFCEDNGMSSKQVMRISLAIEEIMTLITSENGEKEVEFDIRVYSLQGVIGIRFRYSGKEYNPLSYKEKRSWMMFIWVFG